MYHNQYGHDNNYYQDDNRYGYDNNHPKKSSHVDIQKIKCVNSNINVNGIDITEIPQDANMLAAANEAGAGPDGTNTQNGNGLGDRINFDRNLVNICINVNVNDQLKVSPPTDGEPQPPTCEECFTQNLQLEEINDLLSEIGFISDSNLTLQELCDFIADIVAAGNQEQLQFLSSNLALAFLDATLTEDQFNTVLDCLNDIFNNAIPPPQPV